MKKSLMYYLSILLIVSFTLVGCSSNEKTESQQDGDGPIKIKVFGPQNADTNLETNSFTKLVEEKFNIDLEWQVTTYDATSASEVRNIALASGDYPDLFLLVPWVDQFSQTDLLRYGKQGVVLPLNDLIDQYAPNIKEVLENHPYYASMVTAPDGNIYGLPHLNECFHCSYGNKLWINTDWLEKLKLDMPQTTEDLKTVLTKFKTQDPNGNGKQDEVPLSGSPALVESSIIPYLMNGFIYDDSRSRLIMKNGKVDLAANKEEWKEGLSYIRSLYEEGLIYKGAFSQNTEAQQKLGNNAEAQIVGASTAMHPGVFVTEEKYSKFYDAAPPLKGPHSAYTTYNFPSTPGGAFVLTNNASEEAQIAAIKLVDYMFTGEGRILSHHGEKDVSWREPKEGEVAIEEGVEPNLAQIPLGDGEKPRNDNWGAQSQYYHSREFRDGLVQATDIYTAEGYERRLQEATHLYEGKEASEVFPHWAIWIDPAVADETAMIKTNIEEYIEQNALQFITGSKDLDKDWDSYVKGFEQLDLKRYLEIMQEAYDNSSL
ncbi:ABC transporter substrate-binding protein [Bacillus sp. SA1-12]|uniref:extracellular solute-binding protein n=1 Tax=Bacillus sp. SA1-12 TaxID=1455638 RepID=UPI000626A14A|nr:extracellular solute-binding protein [Bacillus sp. SA1-12]KKI92726.1 ABC transporter substrate-binding protein [Bacillus sp. SA1-12]